MLRSAAMLKSDQGNAPQQSLASPHSKKAKRKLEKEMGHTESME